jgi:plastocyanin
LFHRPATYAREDDQVLAYVRGVSYIELAAEGGKSQATEPFQRGGIKMRNRAVWFIVGIVLVCVLALIGTGFAVAATHWAFGTSGTAQASASQAKPVFGVTHVHMRADAFTPAHIQVVLGTTVTWTNQDNIPHHVTFSPVVISSSNNWESGLLYPGQSFSSTFTSRGTFQYHCQEHPGSMIGTVIVT